MNAYCKIETEEDYAYFFQYDPNENIYFPCLFNIDTIHLNYINGGVGLLLNKSRVLEHNAVWVTVEEMKQLTFIRSLEM